ncbi:MAG TPA: SAF domain-containing protein [Candidatus Methylomirabilis sp.]|nr:SAF domain-containing protein [Candidatus Methylomirabilis sp.]
MRIRPELIIGVALVVVAFLALFLVANILNPPAQLVLVATRDIQAGERLTPELARAVEVQLPFVDSFILEAEADQFEGAVFIEAVHQNEPIHTASLVDADNPAAIFRSSLALDDPNLVAFVVPVSPETAPPDIREGDRVDLTLGVGSVTFLAGSLSVVPTPNPFEPREVFVGGLVESGGQTFLTTPVEPSGQLPIPQVTAAPTATQFPQVTLPIAKSLVRNALVLRVVYDQRPNPGFTGEGQSAFIRGDIQALVLAIPMEGQEIVTFALANGDVRVAVRSPLASEEDGSPTLGMSWDDLVAFFYAERELGLQAIDPEASLLGPGASALWPTQRALNAPTVTPTPTALPPSPTPTSTSTATATPGP